MTVINIANKSIKWVAIVSPNKNQEPKYKENAVHHIQDRICKIKCLTFSSGICLKGFKLELITPCQLLLINSNMINSKKLRNLCYLILVSWVTLFQAFQHKDIPKLLH